MKLCPTRLPKRPPGLHGSWPRLHAASWGSVSRSHHSFPCLAPVDIVIWGPCPGLGCVIRAGVLQTAHRARVSGREPSLPRGQRSPPLAGSPGACLPPAWQSFLPPPQEMQAELPLLLEAQVSHPGCLSEPCLLRGKPQERSGEPTWMAMGTILLTRFLYSKQMGAARNCSVQGSVLLASMPSSSSKSTMKMFPCCRKREKMGPNQCRPEKGPGMRPGGRDGSSRGPSLSGAEVCGSLCPAQRLHHKVREWQCPSAFAVLKSPAP